MPLSPSCAHSRASTRRTFSRVRRRTGRSVTRHSAHPEGCRHRQHDSRFPVVLLDMGARRNRARARHDRNLHGAYGRKRRQSGIRQRRQVRKAPRPDGGLVGVRDREPVTPAPAGWTAPPTLWSGAVLRTARCAALAGPVRPFTTPARPCEPDRARRRTAVPEGRARRTDADRLGYIAWAYNTLRPQRGPATARIMTDIRVRT